MPRTVWPPLDESHPVGCTSSWGHAIRRSLCTTYRHVFFQGDLILTPGVVCGVRLLTEKAKMLLDEPRRREGAEGGTIVW